jgi:hypothetical protein
MHRYMEFIGNEGGTTGNALKYYEKIINVFGKGIILRAGFKGKSLIARLNNFGVVKG